ncbi:MAG: hypothetical protein WCA07_12560 [Gloeobacterales cyanobacterium]
MVKNQKAQEEQGQQLVVEGEQEYQMSKAWAWHKVRYSYTVQIFFMGLQSQTAEISVKARALAHL